MSIYNFPGDEKKEQKTKKIRKSRLVAGLVLASFLASLLGFLVGYLFVFDLKENEPPSFSLSEKEKEVEKVSTADAIVDTVREASPGVVSIVVTKDVPIMERYYYNPFEEYEDYFGEDFDIRVPQYREKGTEEREIGGGTGFIVSSDGLILTNKHVVREEDARYTVFTNEGEKFEANVLALDPLQDIAVLKIEDVSLPVLKLGDSDEAQIGQTVVAIGNVLGEFRNSATSGIISGLSRNITATGGGSSQSLRGIIQTDAAINQGNSGGPLLNLKGEVIGINTAMAVGAENVGFAIPINRAKKAIEDVKTHGEVVYPFLGIYYTTVTPALSEEFDLPVDYGAWVGRNAAGEKTETAVFPGSPGEEVGLKRDDIITKFDGRKISLQETLADIIIEYSPGDTISLEIVRNGERITKEATLSQK